MRTIVKSDTGVLHHYAAGVLVVIRFRADAGDDGAGLGADLDTAHAVLATRPGYLGGDVGRNLDDPTLWTMVTRWRDVGSYRRALSSYDAKMHAIPLLSRAIDEPSAYETTDSRLNIAGARGEEPEPG